MEREKVDQWLEWGILGLALALIWVAVLAIGGVRGSEFAILEWIMCALLALWIIRIWVRAEHRFLWHPVCWSVLFFFAFAWQRYPFAPVEYAAREEVLKVTLYTLFFFAVLDNLNRQETSQIFLFGLFVLGGLVAMYAVYQFITGSERVWTFIKPEGYKGRGSGSYICPNHLAGFLELLLPLALAFTVTSRLKATPKVFLGYATLVIGAGLGVTLSRGGWLAAGVSIALFFALLLRYRNYRLPAILLLLLMLAGGVLFAKKAYTPRKRFEQLFTHEHLDNARAALQKPAFQIWQEHPWAGGGPAQFDHLFRKHRPLDIQMTPVYVHNDYLNTLADYGGLGLAGVLSALLILFFGVIRSWKYIWRSTDLGSKPSNRAALVLGASLGLCALLIHSLVDFNMHVPANALTAVALIALLAGHFRYTTERLWVRFGWLGKILASIVCCLGIACLAWDAARRGPEGRALNRVLSAAAPEGERISLLQRAWAAEPGNAGTAGAMGEALRLKAWEGMPGYDSLARDASRWFKVARRLNPLDPEWCVKEGMCLDWLKEFSKAEPLFQKAVELDPRNYWVLINMGWHYFQKGEYAQAKIWFDRSVEIRNDAVARFYLEQIRQRQTELPSKSA